MDTYPYHLYPKPKFNLLVRKFSLFQTYSVPFNWLFVYFKLSEVPEFPDNSLYFILQLFSYCLVIFILLLYWFTVGHYTVGNYIQFFGTVSRCMNPELSCMFLGAVYVMKEVNGLQLSFVLPPDWQVVWYIDSKRK